MSACSFFSHNFNLTETYHGGDTATPMETYNVNNGAVYTSVPSATVSVAQPQVCANYNNYYLF